MHVGGSGGNTRRKILTRYTYNAALYTVGQIVLHSGGVLRTELVGTRYHACRISLCVPRCVRSSKERWFAELRDAHLGTESRCGVEIGQKRQAAWFGHSKLGRRVSEDNNGLDVIMVLNLDSTARLASSFVTTS